MPRIVSLLPSLTEIVCALGLEEHLVGRSHECDFPASVQRLPACTEPKLDASAPSRAIDDRVKALVRDGLSVYRVDAERLRALAPDVVLTQDQCAVCAASLPDVEQALAAWTGGAPRVLSVSPSSLADVWGDVQRVAEAADAPDRGRALVQQLTERVSELGERAGKAAAAGGARPRVACIEWLDPLMGAGHWMPELVALAGGRMLLGAAGAPSPWITWEALVEADPDALLVTPCGFDLPRTRAELPALTRREGFAELRAARAGRVYLADGNAYFNRPGPRLVESLEILVECLHPDDFPARHRGAGWASLEP